MVDKNHDDSHLFFLKYYYNSYTSTVPPMIAGATAQCRIPREHVFYM